MAVSVPDALEGVTSSQPLDRVPRFNRTERAVHWIQASTFIVLLLTGFALSLAPVEAVLGHRDLLRELHLAVSFFFFFGPAIVGLSADRARLVADVADIDAWDADDLRWLIPFPILRAFGVATPPQGRFNAGQKLNAIFVAGSTVIFSLSGLVLWQNRRFPIDLVARSNTVHQMLAYLALAAFLGHVFLATAYPKTKHSFNAMTRGWIDRDFAAAHHPKWLAGWTPSPPPPVHDRIRTAVQIALGSTCALFAGRVLFFGLGANVTDKVTGWLYALTAWPGAASVRPATGQHVFDVVGTGYALAGLVLWLLADRTRRRPA